jgi:hypothetical protein
MINETDLLKDPQKFINIFFALDGQIHKCCQILITESEQIYVGYETNKLYFAKFDDCDWVKKTLR